MKYNNSYVFNNLDKILCSEKKVGYVEKKLTPFYYNHEKRIKVFNDDSLHLLKKIPDSCIDMIFADPPYFGNQSGLIIKRTNGHTETFDTQKAGWFMDVGLVKVIK